MEELFISYRRADTGSEAGRLFEHLEAAFEAGTVFKDVDSIPGGRDFREVIVERLRGCKVVLALIGPDWLDARLADGSRRLDDPKDYVRLEIETAMDLGKLVIPVLVNETAMPTEETLPGSLQKLCHRNALKLRPDPDFKTDSARLARHIEESPGVTFAKRMRSTSCPDIDPLIIETIGKAFVAHLEREACCNAENRQFAALQGTDARHFTHHEEWTALLKWLDDRHHPHPFKNAIFKGCNGCVTPLELFQAANRRGVDLGNGVDRYGLEKELFLSKIPQAPS